jgi:VIT1/CCC1 family predicted Fe2+/Mn2+ transporter
LAVPEKIFNLESRPSVRSAASLASCAGARGVHTAGGALLGSATPILFFVFPSSSTTTLTCSLPITHLYAHTKTKTKNHKPRPRAPIDIE